MLILWILSVLWAVGTFFAIMYMAWDIGETWLGRAVSWMVAFPLWFVLGVAPMGFLHHEEGPQLTTLLKSDWHCSAAHEETTTTYIQVGKVMVPQIITSSVCDQYARN